MWRYIFRRELLDHLTSMRFALTLILTVALMGLNGLLTAGGKFQGRVNSFIENQQNAVEGLKKRATDLAELGIKGPGMLYKRPSPLGFCAGGRDEYLPGNIWASFGATYSGGWGMTVYEPWYLHYNTPNAPPQSGIVAEFAEIDWVFIVGLVLGLMAILLTFDGICGDRQAGTLQLMLSGAVSRAAVIGGKFLGALTVLLLALVVGVAVNLVIIALLGTVSLDGTLLLKIAAMLGAAALYLAFFAGLGLLFSARCERPATSLVLLLLVWTVLVFLLPNTTAGVVSSFQEKETVTWKDKNDATEANWKKHGVRDLRYSESDGKPPYEFVKKFADFADGWLAIDRQFSEGLLRQKLEQVELGKHLNRITPYGIFQSAMESLADTGLPRHRRFIQDARRYEKTFRDFVQVQDAADPDSYHLMGIIKGMSHREIPEEAVPIFAEDLSARTTILATVPDLVLLALFAVAAFMGAHLAFLRGGVA